MKKRIVGVVLLMVVFLSVLTCLKQKSVNENNKDREGFNFFIKFAVGEIDEYGNNQRGYSVFTDKDSNGNKASGECCKCGECTDEGGDSGGSGGSGGDDSGGSGGSENGGCPEGQCCTCGSYEGKNADGTPNGNRWNGASHNDGSYNAAKDDKDGYANCCMVVLPPDSIPIEPPGGITPGPGDPTPTYAAPDPGAGESSLYVCDTSSSQCTRVVYMSSAVDSCSYECAPDCSKQWLRQGCLIGWRQCFADETSCGSRCAMPYSFYYYCKSLVPTPWIWNADLTPTPDPLTPTPTPILTPTPTPIPDDTNTCVSWPNWYLDCKCLAEDGCFLEEGVCRASCLPWAICDVDKKECYRGYYTIDGSKCYINEYPNDCYSYAGPLPIGVIDERCNTYCAGGSGNPPTLPEDPIDISNESDLIIIDPDSEGRNQVCQVDNKNKIALFYVTVETDSIGGGDDISTIGLRFDIGGTNNLTVVGTNLGSSSRGAFVASGLGMGRASVSLMSWSWEVTVGVRTVVFKVDFNDGFPTNLSSLQVSAIDINNNNLPATDTGRKFRYWDCKVDYSGSLFDDSGNPVDRQVCSVSGYSTPISDDINFDSLEFINTDDTMPAIKLDGKSFTKTVGKELLWGSSYTAKFNNDLFAESPLNRTIDLNIGTTLCHNSPGDVLDLGASSGGSFPAFPYAAKPAIKIDFSWLGYAEAWFQVVGGGIQAGGDVINIMPGSEKMSVSNADLGIDNDSWVIAGGSIVKGRSNTFGIRNWNVEKGRNLINKSFGYNYFDNQYRIKKSKGEVVANWDNIKNQTEGVYFINGSLVIDADNAISVGKYLVVVVKGNLTINQDVKKIEGIFIVDGNVSIAGENASNDQLVINGMIYAGGSVTMTRSYANHKLNNTLPATIIYFRPDLIFNLPGELSKTVSGWKEGR